MIPYIETHIVDECNLKCKGCSHFSSIAKPKKKDLMEFSKEFKRLSEITDIGTIRIMGGEPLLNNDFHLYCQLARGYFPNSKICLVTNGLLAKKLEQYTYLLNKNRITVVMSNYHLNQNKDIIEKFDSYEIHEKGQMYNISLDVKGSQDIQKAWEKCDITRYKWYYFQDGRMYNCCIGGNIETFLKHFNLDFGIGKEDISIDIFKHDIHEIDDFLNKPSRLCAYCNTFARERNLHDFAVSKGEISEWIYQ